MTTVMLIRDAQGRMRGYTEADDRKYQVYKRKVADLEPGGEEIVLFSWEDPRSPRHHNKFMRKVRVLLKRTEAFDDFDALRKWLVAGAGYVEPDGSGGYQAQSLAFKEMDEADFAELHRRVDDFLWSDRATTYLWSHLTESARHACIEGFFYEVESARER